MKNLILPVLIFCVFALNAQSYKDSIRVFRDKYRLEFIEDAHSPLKADDTAFLRFYAPDAHYRVSAIFRTTPESSPFEIETHSGKKKPYRKYGELSFKLKNKACTLEVYQSMDLMKKPEFAEYLFIPFNDLTNYEETYGGGRYLDIRMGDIKAGRVIIDFNKCYNPYCAYAGGYSCPIPPEANKLPLRIPAGEKLFGKAVKE